MVTEGQSKGRIRIMIEREGMIRARDREVEIEREKDRK